MKGLVIGGSAITEPRGSSLLVPPRLAVGVGIALGFGVPKLAAFDTYLAEARASGAPAPLVPATALLAVEISGGVALAVGFATRAAGMDLSAARVGGLLVPGQHGFAWDATPFLLGGYQFAVSRAGRYSVDSRIAGHVGPAAHKGSEA